MDKWLAVLGRNIRTFAALVIFCASVAVADTQWKSPSSGAWNMPGNWTNGVPGVNGGQPTWFVGDRSLQHTQLLFGITAPVKGIGYGRSSGGGGFVINDGGAPAMLLLKAGGPIGGIINRDTNAQLFNVPISFIGSNSFYDRSASQVFNAAAGDLRFSGRYLGDRPTIHNGGGELTVDGAFNTTIGLSNGRGDITGPGGLTKKGTGTLTLDGTNANTYLGDTLLYQGTLVVKKEQALGKGGLTLFGGTFVPNGHPHDFGSRLGLQGPAAIDFGPGQTNALSFGDSSAFYWPEEAMLRVLNWKGGQASKLRFGTNSAALTPKQLRAIVFPGLPQEAAVIDAEGFVVPGK